MSALGFCALKPCNDERSKSEEKCRNSVLEVGLDDSWFKPRHKMRKRFCRRFEINECDYKKEYSDGAKKIRIYFFHMMLRVYHERTCPKRGVRRQGGRSYRWAHPTQQQGRRFPAARLSPAHLMRWVRVSIFFADSIQQIHSLRASGVMSCHVARDFGSRRRSFLRSTGRL